MKKQILTLLLIALTWSISFAAANYVYHEQTANNPGCGSNSYISSTTPTSSESVTIAFKVEYQNYTDQVRVYYTTDGSSPSGAFGVGVGSTQVLVASFDCTFLSGQNVDVCSATIPALPSGTVVKYVVSAWHSGGGDEIFANSGEFSSPFTSALLATQYSYTVATATPVTLSQFDAASRDDKVALNWITETELNNDYFNLERSNDLRNWTSITKINGAGTDNQKNEYQFMDYQPSSGTNYYRLRQTDFDGQFTISDVISVFFEKNNMGAIFPSFAKDIIHIRTADENTEFIISNMVGQPMKTSTNNDIDVSSLPKGWYWIQSTINKQPQLIGRFYKF